MAAGPREAGDTLAGQKIRGRSTACVPVNSVPVETSASETLHRQHATAGTPPPAYTWPQSPLTGFNSFEATSLVQDIKSQTDESKPLRSPPTSGPNGVNAQKNIAVSLANAAAVNAGAISV
ncbi:hypothetical protein EYF80_054128 [Liparis tanakae]|uniref:Uncharacterized protein n=1 Tax=Liparis tanakae TaxID=230148 RepID=A0A4Z2F3A7_9TELE|nr:hypothetical protein EYF80_054128 [Liparis tanakae]